MLGEQRMNRRLVLVYFFSDDNSMSVDDVFASEGEQPDDDMNGNLDRTVVSGVWRQFNK